MTLARKNQVCLEITPYYHLVNRCVRRGFLCGYDKLTRKDYSHRKQWMLDRIKYLVDSFAIRCCAYAIMSNHYHLVVCVDSSAAQQWTRDDVLTRYERIHSTRRIRDLLDNESALTPVLREEVDQTIETWRARLTSISWFEKCLNETMARLANAEDSVSGRFWQGRFKSQPLLDDAALITCMAYVDLNPIRAGIADSLEASDFTSIQARLKCFMHAQEEKPVRQSEPGGRNLSVEVSIKKTRPETTKKKARNTDDAKDQHRHGTTIPAVDPIPLVPLRDHTKLQDSGLCLPLTHQQYFLLLDATGRLIQEGRPGHIHDDAAPVLCRLGINPAHWLDSQKDFSKRFPGAIGAIEAIQNYLVKLTDRCRCVGVTSCKALFTKREVPH